MYSTVYCTVYNLAIAFEVYNTTGKSQEDHQNYQGIQTLEQKLKHLRSSSDQLALQVVPKL